MDFISMDLIGEFHPPSTHGNKYALTFICMLSGWTWCIPIPDKTAPVVILHGPFESICRSGVNPEKTTYSRRSHASLPPQPVNRAVQYLRRFSQDPQSTQIRISHKQLESVYACIFGLLIIYCCNKKHPNRL